MDIFSNKYPRCSVITNWLTMEEAIQQETDIEFTVSSRDLFIDQIKKNGDIDGALHDQLRTLLKIRNAAVNEHAPITAEQATSYTAFTEEALKVIESKR
jgi:hypothetical protein